MEFLYSPGFGGACALLAAGRRTDAIAHCWDRYVWVVDHANQIGVRLTVGLLNRITDTAAGLGDRDLVEFSRQFALELFSATGDDEPSTDVTLPGDNEGGNGSEVRHDDD